MSNIALGGATENARKRKCGTMKKQGVENAGKEKAAQDCRGGKYRKGKCGTRLQAWKTQERKMRHKNSGVENAGKGTCVIKLNQHKVNDKR